MWVRSWQTPRRRAKDSAAVVVLTVGLDYLGAAPVRGTRYGGTGESMKVAVQVDEARQQSQQQSQT